MKDKTQKRKEALERRLADVAYYKDWLFNPETRKRYFHLPQETRTELDELARKKLPIAEKDVEALRRKLEIVSVS